MTGFLERRFGLRGAGTSPRTEALAGATTFFTLSYILFVQPAIMQVAGIPLETAFFATCAASAFACVLMGLLANYPIALAPAMGHNLFFSFIACAPLASGGLGLSWQQGLAANFLSGSLFIALALVKFREQVLRALPDSLKHAIAAGIGLMIALVGLEFGGLVQDDATTLVKLGDLSSPLTQLALFGIALTVALLALRVRAALFLGMLGTLAAGLVTRQVPLPEAIVTRDFACSTVLGELDFAGLLHSNRVVEVVFVLFFLDVFDTVGTLVGVGARAGFLRNGELPRAGRALFCDAAATVVGASLGTSTVTSYVESAAGIQAGGRTGLANLFTAGLFLLALPFAPLIAAVGSPIVVEGRSFYPVLAPALVAVGALMAKSATYIDWDDPAEATPSFLAMFIIPMSFSITEGIAFGCIGLSLASVVTGRARRMHPLLHLLAIAFLLRYILLA